MAFKDTLIKSETQKIVDKVIARASDRMQAELRILSMTSWMSGWDRVDHGYRIDEFADKIVEWATPLRPEECEIISELPDQFLAAVLRKFSAENRLALVNLGLSKSRYRTLGTEVTKALADTLAELAPIPMSEREGMQAHDFLKANGMADMIFSIDAMLSATRIVETADYMEGKYPDLYVTHLVSAVKTVRDVKCTREGIIDAMGKFPELKFLEDSVGGSVSPLLGLKDASPADMVAVVNEILYEEDSPEYQGEQILEALKIAEELNGSPLEGPQDGIVTTVSPEAFELGIRLGVDMRLSSPVVPYQDEMGAWAKESEEAEKEFWISALPHVERSIDTISDPEWGPTNPVIDTEGHTMGRLLKVAEGKNLPADRVATLIARMCTWRCPLEAVTESGDLDYWMPVAAYAYTTCDEPGATTMESVGGMVLSALLKTPRGVEKVLDWMEANSDVRTVVWANVLLNIAKVNLPWADTGHGEGVVERFVNHAVRIIRDNSGSASALRDILMADRLISLVSADSLRSIMDNDPESARSLTAYDRWFSPTAVDREEKVRIAMKFIGTVEIGSDVFDKYPAEKIKDIMDHYGWEDTPEFNSFVGSLPETTTLSDLSELYGK